MDQHPDVYSELLGLRSGQEHPIVQRVEKPRIADPFLFLDDDPVHDGDLAGRSAETQERNPEPCPEGFAKGHTMTGWWRNGAGFGEGQIWQMSSPMLGRLGAGRSGGRS